ncbi:MAG TPA: ribosome small subunit-dependent GTPase A [Acidobacteriota bacterium]|nr:ribosome small subunit-dependent GTPase A [Acidobacteriota bacterium]
MTNPSFIVAQVLGRTAILRDGDSIHEAVLSGRLKEGARGSRETTLAVGDRVDVERPADGPWRILGVAPRRTQLERSAGGHGASARTQIIAANADQTLIVASLRDPPFRPGLVDRWSLLARRGGLTPLLALNKADLGTEEEARRAVAEACIPLEMVRVSATTGFGIETLRAHLSGLVTILVGHSGVGKSSILRTLIPDADAATGELSGKSGKGRHTTTSSRLYPLPEGGYLIDTPGVRSVVLGETHASEAASVFPEIADAEPCRFRECTHRMEPGCAVLAGLESGSIPRLVYQRYKKLLEEVDLR